MAYKDDGPVDQKRTQDDLKLALTLLDIQADAWNTCPKEGRQELVKAKLRKAQLKYHSDKTQNLSEEEKQKYAENFKLVTRIFKTEFDDIKQLNTNVPFLFSHVPPRSHTPSSAPISTWDLFCVAMSTHDLIGAAIYLDHSRFNAPLFKKMLLKVAELELNDQRQLLSFTLHTHHDETTNVLKYVVKKIGFYDIDFLNQLLEKIQTCLFAETKKQILNEIVLIEVTQLFYNSLTILDANARPLENVINTLLKAGANLTARSNDGLNLLDFVTRNHPQMIAFVLLKAHGLSPDAQHEFLMNTSFRTVPGTREAAQAEVDASRKDYVNQVNNILRSSGFDKHYKIICEKAITFEKYQYTGCNAYYAFHSIENLKRKLDKARDEFLSAGTGLDMNENERIFKARCIKAINDARPVLEQHRGWSKLLAGFLLALITLPISLPAYALGFFSIKTDSAEKLDAFEKELNSGKSALGA